MKRTTKISATANDGATTLEITIKLDTASGFAAVTTEAARRSLASAVMRAAASPEVQQVVFELSGMRVSA